MLGGSCALLSVVRLVVGVLVFGGLFQAVAVPVVSCTFLLLLFPGCKSTNPMANPPEDLAPPVLVAGLSAVRLPSLQFLTLLALGP